MRIRWRVLFAVALVVVVGAAAYALCVAERFLPEAIYPGGSTIKDEHAPGGFAQSKNFPQDLAGRDWGTAGAVSLVAFPDEPAQYGKREGLALRLINRTNGVVGFTACDSCLYLTQEVRGWDGRWRPVESPPKPICGRSYHRVFLDKNQYWEFPALRRGVLKTKYRFRLDQGTLRPYPFHTEEERQIMVAETGGEIIYSNEFK